MSYPELPGLQVFTQGDYPEHMNSAAEHFVSRVLADYGFHRTRPPELLEAVDAILGQGGYVNVGGPWIGESRIGRISGRWQIQTQRGISVGREHWGAWWQLAQWLLAQYGVDEQVARQVRAQVAAALMLPASEIGPIRGEALAHLAEHFRSTQAACAMRVADVDLRPTAVVVPERWARIRGDVVGFFPRDRGSLEAMAVGNVRRLRVRRERLTDEPSRPYVLVAA